jgi:hypothetical protein
MTANSSWHRREFIYAIGAGLVVLGADAERATAAEEMEEVSPPEDLMREHGLL